jgi:hypothetical protein
MHQIIKNFLEIKSLSAKASKASKLAMKDYIAGFAEGMMFDNRYDYESPSDTFKRLDSGWLIHQVFNPNTESFKANIPTAEEAWVNAYNVFNSYSRKPLIISRYRHLILEYNQRKREEKLTKRFRKSVKDYKPKTI